MVVVMWCGWSWCCVLLILRPAAVTGWSCHHTTTTTTTTTATTTTTTTRWRNNKALCRGTVEVAAAARGGGGFGGGGSSSSKAGNVNHKKKRKKSLEWADGKANGDDETSSVLSSSSSSLVLDKWGLPPPTLEDIFPPLPEGTELIPVVIDDDDDSPKQTKKKNVRQKIQEALSNYLELNLETCFDEEGTERAQQQQRKGDHQNKMQLKLMHVSPPVLVIEHFLTPQECLEVQHVAMPPPPPTNTPQSKSSPPSSAAGAAVQVDSATFTGSYSTRTSTSWFCHFHQVPTLMAKLNHVLGISLYIMEEPQIVRYQSGQEFSWHYDEVPINLANDNGGQRVATILVYLTTLPEHAGGATVFRDLKQPQSSSSTTAAASTQPLAVHPVQGRALIFFPATADGIPDDRTLHKGQVVATSGGHEKRMVQVWIHERAYKPILPPGNSQQQALPHVKRALKELGYK